MSYNRLVILLLITLFILPAFAQTQQGFVKTKGRMINGKHVPGQGLSGATVNIQGGNSIAVRNTDGSFSFVVPDKKFKVQSVKKNGYALVDADATTKTYHYSTNPFYLVMEKPEQQAQDLLESERKIRRTIQRKLQEKEDELEALKEAHKITIAEYQESMQELYSSQRNNETLISKMAKEYAQLDYDQMNELNRRVHDAISNGRLTEADSLIRSKGDLKSRIEKVKQEELTETEREKEIEEDKKSLEEAKAGTQKEKEDIADDCDILSRCFMLELETDSAIYYIELLVSLESTDIYTLGRAGDFYGTEMCMYDKAEEYYTKALDISKQSTEKDEYQVVALQNNLASTYLQTGRFPEAEKLMKENLEIVHRNGGMIQLNTDDYIINDGIDYGISDYFCLTALAGLYTTMKRYADAEKTYHTIIDLLDDGTLGYEDKKLQDEKATAIFQLGLIYCADEQFERGDSLILESTNIYRGLAVEEPFFWGSLAGNLLFCAFTFFPQERYEQCEAMCMNALEAFRNDEKNTNESQELNIAQIWYLLALVCQATERPTESEKWFLDAMSVFRRYANAIPNKYGDLLCNVIGGLATLYKSTGRLNESESLFTECLDKVIHLAPMDPGKFNPQIIAILRELGKIKLTEKRYQEADSLFNQTLVKSQQFAVDDADTFDNYVYEAKANLANLYSIMGVSSRKSQQFEESEQLLLKAFEYQQELSSKNQVKFEPGLATIMKGMADLYWDTKRYQKAENMYDSCLIIMKRHAKENDNIQTEYGNLLYRLSQRYLNIHNYSAAYKVYKEWIPIIKQQYEEYPELMRDDYAESMARQSFFAIFQSQFKEAEQLARDGLKMDSTLRKIVCNLAPALLFQGKYTEAQQIYIQYKSEWKDTFLDDFKLFAEAGVIPKKREKDVEKIKQLLNK